MDTPDILIYVHPELSAEGRSKIENALMGCAGVLAADFDQHTHAHALKVLYNSGVISGKQILAAVRQYDPAASMVGL
ncbi:MAG: hypothetical protein HY016_11575 [Nitrosomonadales bacterium]|nr:hypothetical protein [Nitrosomonadales bacterium]